MMIRHFSQQESSCIDIFFISSRKDMLWVLIRSAHIFSWRNKKNISRILSLSWRYEVLLEPHQKGNEYTTKGDSSDIEIFAFLLFGHCC